MNSKPAYVTSDVHLHVDSSARAARFHSWIEWAAVQASTILINGDLFDFWFEYGSVIPRGHVRTLGLLSAVVDSGVPVHLTGGNHDWWGGTFLTDEVGVRFHPEPVRLDLGGRRCLVAHGDGLGRGDLGYRALRKVLRSPLSRGAFRWIHPDVGAALARRVSRTHARTETGQEPDRERAGELERWARERLLEDEALDAVLLGHVHRPVRVEVAPDRFYLNSGDWLHHDSYVVVCPAKAPYLATWEDGREVVRAGRSGPRAGTRG
jgi:UDP-2,3-diacylglucosamine hydrolase